jgi:N-acetylglucosaminyldiphosphoundecaprenol N-acetyl-beta-D-mannosaminyltransferase
VGGNVTGSPVHIAKTTRALAARGVEVVPLELDLAAARGPLQLVRILRSAFSGLRGLRPSLAHVHGHIAACAVLPVARLLRIPLVVELHGLYVRSDAENPGTRPVLSGLAKLLELPTLRRAEHVIAQAQAMKERLVRHGIEEGRVTVIYPGLRTAEFAEYAGPAAVVPAASPDEKLLVYVGSTHRYQGLDLLAYAQRLLPQNYRLALVLSRDSGAPEDVVTRFGFDPLRTLAVHPANPSEIPAWTKRADVLVHARPDLPDNINVQSKLGLYLAAGKPVVATDVGDYRLLMGASPGCVLSPPEPEAFARAILTATTDPEIARAARRENVALARRYFEADVNAERLVTIYHGVARREFGSRLAVEEEHRAPSAAPHSGTPGPAATVLGVPIWGLTLGGFVDLAMDRIRVGRPTLFTTANAHSIVTAQSVPGFLAHFQEADAVLPDGILAVFGARRCGGQIPERVAGADFTGAFLARAAREGVSVFFLGTDDRTLSRLVEECVGRFPGIVVRGTLAPPFGTIDDETNLRLVEAVNRSGADALFVAMTAPKQELWLSRNRGALRPSFCMGIGAAFDFLAGTKRRVPRIIGQLGGEWLFRLAREPRRLWRRNLDSAAFLWMLFRYRGRSKPKLPA